MAIFHLHHHHHHHQGPPRSFFKFKLFTLFCLLSWASSTTTPAPPPPPPSALAASHFLKTRGYFLFAHLIAAAAGTDSWNGTGTVFAPPDFAFSFTTAKFNNYGRSPPPRPSSSLLLYHTLKQPLTSYNLTAYAAEGNELRTWHTNRCVFVSKVFNGNLAITGAKKTIATVKIRQPDLYADDRLTVHGVDGVLDPNSVSKCIFPDQTAQTKSPIDQSFIDHAVRALSRRGFSVVATAMAIKRSNLTNLAAVTVFAPSDASLFSDSKAFQYDFLHHVVPGRFRFNDIARLSAGTAIETLSPNKTVVIQSENCDVTVNGVALDNSEVYLNRWIVVLSVSHSIDHASDSSAKTQISNGFSQYGLAGAPALPSYFGDSVGTSPFSGQLSDFASMASSYFTDSEVNSQFPGEYSKSDHGGVPSPAPSYSYEVTGNVESQAPARTGEYSQGDMGENSRRSPPPATEGQALADRQCSPGVSPARTDGVLSTVSLEVEGEDLFCPVAVRRLRGTSVYVEKSPRSTPYGQLSEKLVQSGPSHQFNKLSEKAVESVPSDENETGQFSEVLSAEVGRRELSSLLSSGSEALSGKSGVPADETHHHLSIADDLFYYI